MCSTNSINPCKKATLGPTSLILEGSGKLCFLGRFPSGQKGVQKSMDEVVWRLLGAKWAHDGCARVSDLGEGPLGLASRARSLEDYKIRMFGRSEVHIGRSEVHKIRKIGSS